MGAQPSAAQCCCTLSTEPTPDEPMQVKTLALQRAFRLQGDHSPCSSLESSCILGSPVAASAKPSPRAHRASGEAGEVFHVGLTKVSGWALGVDVNHTDQRTLRIVQLSSQGLIPGWNATNGSKRIDVGDRILSVNGIEGNAAAMMEACRTSPHLQLTIRRGD